MAAGELDGVICLSEITSEGGTLLYFYWSEMVLERLDFWWNMLVWNGIRRAWLLVASAGMKRHWEGGEEGLTSGGICQSEMALGSFISDGTCSSEMALGRLHFWWHLLVWNGIGRGDLISGGICWSGVRMVWLLVHQLFRNSIRRAWLKWHLEGLTPDGIWWAVWQHQEGLTSGGNWYLTSWYLLLSCWSQLLTLKSGWSGHLSVSYSIWWSLSMYQV